MPDPGFFRILERLSPGTAAALIFLALLAIGLSSLATLGVMVVKLVVSQRESQRAQKARHEIAEAAACNFPAELVQQSRDAILLQRDTVRSNEVVAQRTADNLSLFGAGLERLTVALNRHTEKLIEYLAETRASRRTRGD